MKAVLLIDFGSTYTKVTAVDLDTEEIIGTSQSFTTIETDINDGLNNAVKLLREQIGDVEFSEQYACSSAAGGLKMVAIGLVPELTAKAAKMASLGAGAKVMKTYSYQLTEADLEEILKVILDFAVEKGLCEDSVVYKDLFDTKIMGVLTPRPSEVIKKIKKKYEISPKEATDYYYNLSKKSDYIREYRIKNDVKWITKTEYGNIDITINLAKPEKDPKAIAAATKMEQSS